MFDPLPLPPRLRDFYDLWDRKRGTRKFPARADYRFEELRPWLEELHLVEVLPGDFRFKVFATKSAKRIGREYTGMLLSECEPRALIEDAARDYRRCVETGEPNYADRNNRYADGRHYSWTRVVVPLGADGQTVDHLMICMEYHLI